MDTGLLSMPEPFHIITPCFKVCGHLCGKFFLYLGRGRYRRSHCLKFFELSVPFRVKGSELGFKELYSWSCLLRCGRKECLEGHLSPRARWLGQLDPWDSEDPLSLIWRSLGLSRRLELE